MIGKLLHLVMLIMMKTGNATLNKSIPWNVRIHNNLIKKEKDMLLSIETKYDKAKYDERCLLYKEDILRYVAIIIDLNKKALSLFQKTSPVIYTSNKNNTDNGWSWNNGRDDESLTWLIK